MKKALLFVLCMLFLPLFAHAEEAGFAAKWFEAQKAETIPAGIEAAIDERVYTLALPDGRDALSLCLTVEGDLRFGRYAQLTRTGLIDEATGEDVSLDAVFTDLDALQEFMDTYVEENVLNAALEDETLEKYAHFFITLLQSSGTLSAPSGSGGDLHAQGGGVF